MKDTPLGKMWLIPGDIVSEYLLGGSHWDTHVYSALEPYLTGTVVDVGANVGALALRFAQHAPRVIAYEPHPVLAACLEMNALWQMSQGHAKWISVHRAGLYSRRLKLVCRPVEGNSPSSWAWAEAGPGDPPPHIPCGPVAMREFEEGPPATAIKVDARGGDLHCLLGLEPVIVRDHPAIVMEREDALMAPHGHTWDGDVLPTLKKWGYADPHNIGGCDYFTTWIG